jgi:hypothetical protein
MRSQFHGGIRQDSVSASRASRIHMKLCVLKNQLSVLSVPSVVP